MRCTVYRSPCKEYTYLYLALGVKPEDLPEELKARFGEPEAIMLLDLSRTEKLANADIATVSKKLEEDGFYLQMPPELAVEEEISRRFS